MALGWGQFFGGIGHLLNKLPLQGRKERWKNEIDNLEKEGQSLLKGQWDEKKGKRYDIITARLVYLRQLLKNSAGD